MSNNTLGEQLYTTEMFERIVRWENLLEEAHARRKALTTHEQWGLLQLLTEMHAALGKLAREETRLERTLYGHPPVAPQEGEPIYVVRGDEALRLVIAEDRPYVGPDWHSIDIEVPVMDRCGGEAERVLDDLAARIHTLISTDPEARAMLRLLGAESVVVSGLSISVDDGNV